MNEKANLTEDEKGDAYKQRITVYNFEQEQTEEYAFGEEVPVGIYKGFHIQIS